MKINFPSINVKRQIACYFNTKGTHPDFPTIIHQELKNDRGIQIYKTSTGYSLFQNGVFCNILIMLGIHQDVIFLQLFMIKLGFPY